MRGIFEEGRVGSAGCILDFGPQLAIQPPEFFRPPRGHAEEGRSRSENCGNFSGLTRNSASVSLMTCVKLGRGRSSRMMRAHSASPLNSGNKSGIVFINLSRSEVGNERIAFSISRAVLTAKVYCEEPLHAINQSRRASRQCSPKALPRLTKRIAIFTRRFQGKSD